MRSLYAAFAGFFLGAAVFFTFIVPGAAFAVLSFAETGRLFARVFPGLYAFQAISSLLVLGAGLATWPRGRAEVVCPAVALVITLVSWVWLLPAVNRAIGTARFGSLHGLSLGLEILSMVVVLFGLIANLRQRTR